ncbi:MAG: alpha-amylase [Deltaproteobacteria bacterium]|nr:MAG: alpha-amylase [Deltaproteobacteria bacterium]
MVTGLALLVGGAPGCGDDGGGSSDVSSDTLGGEDGTVADSTVGDTATGDTTGADTSVTTTVLPWSGWDNAVIYFVITDRFFNGNTANDHSYGREDDGDKEIATFHGGDLAGLTDKIEDGYFDALGVSALWITAPYEQVHGWISGNNIKHYAYHGYFALDFTVVDKNMGTAEELRYFIDTAHEHGLRVIFDVVMNHPGYATPADLDEFGVDVLLDGWESATPATLYDYIDFDSANFGDWWGPNWIRAEIGGGYPGPGSDNYTKNVDYLPDFRTESTQTNIGLPVFYKNKADTQAVEKTPYAVRDYLVEWLTDWVRAYGVDGFRCDTAKHVEMASWKALNAKADEALAEWRSSHPDKAFPDSDYADTAHPFWMTGEVFPHGVAKDEYFLDGGFDSVLNFDFQAAASAALDDPSAIEGTWADYAQKINTDDAFNVLTYISSHDTSLFFERYAGKSLDKQKVAGTLLMLTPGAVQVFYGDENARGYGSASSDNSHKTRTDYAWGDNPDVLAHWQKLGRFRKAHRAVGAGSHAKVSDAPYAFVRVKDDDVVYVALGASGDVTLDVSAQFADGTALRDAYTGATASVAGGSVTFTADASGVVLIEEAK